MKIYIKTVILIVFISAFYPKFPTYADSPINSFNMAISKTSHTSQVSNSNQSIISTLIEYPGKMISDISINYSKYIYYKNELIKTHNSSNTNYLMTMYLSRALFHFCIVAAISLIIILLILKKVFKIKDVPKKKTVNFKTKRFNIIITKNKPKRKISKKYNKHK